MRIGVSDICHGFKINLCLLIGVDITEISQPLQLVFNLFHLQCILVILGAFLTFLRLGLRFIVIFFGGRGDISQIIIVLQAIVCATGVINRQISNYLVFLWQDSGCLRIHNIRILDLGLYRSILDLGVLFWWLLT